jgi:hypothetical protein
VEGARVETQDPELRRQLHLTTEDLRFADFIVRHVAEERHDVFLDGVGWEGGDEWIRSQFRVYVLCLLRTSLLQGRDFFILVVLVLNFVIIFLIRTPWFYDIPVEFNRSKL